jgi:hypothetical protein
MTYVFWKRYGTRKAALKEAAKLRKMGKPAKVIPYGLHSDHNHDVWVGLNTHVTLTGTHTGKVQRRY